ncbi:hypothetical protein KCP73_10395 [Salmonella enterica subsp. enterica]|nr:hypothetical protein KCP73_10395 [Salmonella enterica subsp. enterica]
MNDIPPAERGVGVIDFHYALYPISVARNVMFSASKRQAPKDINESTRQPVAECNGASARHQAKSALSAGGVSA